MTSWQKKTGSHPNPDALEVTKQLLRALERRLNAALELAHAQAITDHLNAARDHVKNLSKSHFHLTDKSGEFLTHKEEVVKTLARSRRETMHDVHAFYRLAVCVQDENITRQPSAEHRHILKAFIKSYDATRKRIKQTPEFSKAIPIASAIRHLALKKHIGHMATARFHPERQHDDVMLLDPNSSELDARLRSFYPAIPQDKGDKAKHAAELKRYEQMHYDNLAMHYMIDAFKRKGRDDR